jgi:hypothetical protein
VAHVDVALGKTPAQHIHHLTELEVVVGEHGELELRLLHARVGALEVEAVGDLLVGLLDRVLDFLLIHLRDDVEGGHGVTLP